MLHTTCPNAVETECHPAICKSAHQRTVIRLAFSSFPASLLTLLKIKRSLNHRALDKTIPLIQQTPDRHVILQVFLTASNFCQSPNRRIRSGNSSNRAANKVLI